MSYDAKDCSELEGPFVVYTLDNLIGDIRAALRADTGPAGRRQVCGHVSKALLDKAFVADHLTVEEGKRRRILFEDTELGFCVCAQVYAKALDATPHDHGVTWAIYGVAEGTTEMTEWRIVSVGAGESPTLVEPTCRYTMRPGDCHVYEPGDVHSPSISQGSKLIRIEGANLDMVQRSNIKAA